MNCNQVREAIDSASRYSMQAGGLTSHLNRCPECTRYSNETASLIELLGAQPRVAVPADFEFRMRARMARERAASACDSQGDLSKILPKLFSWSRMASSAAALALVVTASTLFINRYIDRKNEAPQADAVASQTATDPGLRIASSKDDVEATSSGFSSSAKYISRSIKVEKISFQSDEMSESEAEIPAGDSSIGDNTGIDESTRLYSPETKRLLKDRSRFYGAETISISMAKSSATAPTF